MVQQREGQFWQEKWPNGLMSTLTFASFTPLPPLHPSLIQFHPEGNPDDWQPTLETKVRNRGEEKKKDESEEDWRERMETPCLSWDWVEFNSLWTEGGSYRRDLYMKPKYYVVLLLVLILWYYSLYDTDYCRIFFCIWFEANI